MSQFLTVPILFIYSSKGIIYSFIQCRFIQCSLQTKPYTRCWDIKTVRDSHSHLEAHRSVRGKKIRKSLQFCNSGWWVQWWKYIYRTFCGNTYKRNLALAWVEVFRQSFLKMSENQYESWKDVNKLSRYGEVGRRGQEGRRKGTSGGGTIDRA